MILQSMHIHYVHEVEAGTYKYRWGCWRTTDCYSGRKWFFHRWAQIRTDIRSVVHRHWRNPLPLGSRTKGYQGHRSSPCQFLFFFKKQWCINVWVNGECFFQWGWWWGQTFVVDFEANGADALIRLQMEPHLMGHADNQVRHEAASQTAERNRKSSTFFVLFFFLKMFTRSLMQMEYNTKQNKI